VPRVRRRYKLLGAGLGLSAGAPLGWVLIEWARGKDPLETLSAQPLLFGYILLATMVVFGVFSWILGVKEEHMMAAVRQLDELTITDSLTGLRNRRYFLERLDDEVALVQRHGDWVALALIDLDHFKRVNDRYGHPVGDRLLQRVASALSKVVRREAVLARVGGEEMGVLLPRANLEHGRLAAERYRRAIAEAHIIADGARVSVTASVGLVAVQGRSDLSAALLYRWADEALYKAKRAGRNRVTVRRADPLLELDEGLDEEDDGLDDDAPGRSASQSAEP
jgi:diguanylate cyclase (GGDEF)-like protein